MKTRRVLLILAGLLALLLAIPPMLDPEHRSLEEARAQAGGSYAALPLGSVHYQLSGPEAADPIVLVPGFSVPLFTYDRVYDALAQEHRVLRYDHYGRGLSERLDQPHDLDLLVGQLGALLDQLGISAPITLVGHSMGGAVVTQFAVENPQRVERLVLIAPLGYPMPVSATARLVTVPGLGEYLMAAIGHRSLTSRMPSNFAGSYPQTSEWFAEQLLIEGSKRALVSSMRTVLFQDHSARYRALGQHDMPKLLFWGDQDAVLPYRNHERLLADVPGTQMETMPGSGHTPQYEDPERFLARFFAFVGD